MAPRNQNHQNIANFLFEVGILSKTPRSGFFFLGSGKQSVAEHISRTAYVGFVLASMNGKADPAKVATMCLFHDLTEARISDLNYVHQKYTTRDEIKALKELTHGLSFGKKIEKLVEEYEAKKTIESKLAKDADQIEMILSLKELLDVGNARAKKWMPPIIKRLITKEAKELAATILKTDSDAWWIVDKKDKWWVNRNEK